MRYAVAHISFFENDLTIDFIEANSWREAAVNSNLIDTDTAAGMDKLEDLKEFFFDMDAMIDVKEIPNT